MRVDTDVPRAKRLHKSNSLCIKHLPFRPSQPHWRPHSLRKTPPLYRLRRRPLPATRLTALTPTRGLQRQQGVQNLKADSPVSLFGRQLATDMLLVQRTLLASQTIPLQEMQLAPSPGIVERSDEVEGQCLDQQSAVTRWCRRETLSADDASRLHDPCASGGMLYAEGEQLIRPRCWHSIHARCFFAYLESDRESSRLWFAPWAPRCPQCRRPIAET